MIILGLNGWKERGHDGGASILENGRLTYAVEEEKLIGLRHAYDRTPNESISLILKERNLKLDDIDVFSIGWDYPMLYDMLSKDFVSKQEMSNVLFGTEKYANRITYTNHHLAHAFSTFYPSNFKDALVLVIDGQGEYMATSVFEAHRETGEMKLLYETNISLGYFYAGITKHIGFHSGQEGKTMGLASYGKPLFLDELRKYINVNKEGDLQCVFSVKKKSKDEEDETLAIWLEILKKIIPERNGRIIKIDEEIRPYANLATSAQVLLEEILKTLVTKYYKKTGITNVAIAGGVGLNCTSSSAIEALPFITGIFIQPAANDGGISLGTAIKTAIDNGENVDIEMIPYLGPEYSNDEIEKELKKSNQPYKQVENIEEVIAKLLAEQNIVANFQGRLEFGPRALGNRSLLADPREEKMLIRLNTLKGREVWRPLAPAVLFEHQGEYFDYKKFTPHMTKTCNVLKAEQDNLQAITHVDGTARVQSVTKKYNERFYNIIKEFYNITGIPVVINTSFNVKGEPIVCTPKDAIRSSKEMNLDYLAIGDFIVKL